MGSAKAPERFVLRPDLTGMCWDLALYVPTVTFLSLYGLRFWYAGGEDVWIGYVLLFLACFFFLAGANRILKTRLMVLRSAPVAIEVDPKRVRLILKGGGSIALVRGLRFFKDYAGKSFGLTGQDPEGHTQQFVFHRGQFKDPQAFERLAKMLEIYRE